MGESEKALPISDAMKSVADLQAFRKRAYKLLGNGFASFLGTLGTPAQAVKPRGKSPEWPTGKSRTPRKRFPT